MGFSFRGKASGHTPQVSEGQSTGSDISPDNPVVIDPAAGLQKFKKLHKWDPFMDVEKLDAADEVGHFQGCMHHEPSKIERLPIQRSRIPKLTNYY